MDINPVIPRVSHIGIGVTDMDRAIAFYEGGLGFKKAATVTGGQESAKLVGLAGEVRFLSQFMELEGRFVELVQFHAPATECAPLKQFGQTGLTHLSMRVDDLDEAIAKVRRSGGTIMEETFTTVSVSEAISGRIVFCTDPDGTRVELMEFPDFVRFDLPA